MLQSYIGVLSSTDYGRMGTLPSNHTPCSEDRNRHHGHHQQDISGPRDVQVRKGAASTQTARAAMPNTAPQTSHSGDYVVLFMVPSLRKLELNTESQTPDANILPHITSLSNGLRSLDIWSIFTEETIENFSKAFHFLRRSASSLKSRKKTQRATQL